MNRLLFTGLLFLCCSLCQAQTGYLFVKKGIKKKRTYMEYDPIVLRLQNGKIVSGMITRLANDTIFIAGLPIPRSAVKDVIIKWKQKKKFQLDAKTFLLVTGGVALTTAGLTLSNQAEFKEALTAGLTMGYAPILINYLGSKISFSRKKFRIGKKFRLQVLDFYIPRQRAF